MAENQPKAKSKVQGEGDYEAARRYNEATRDFVESENAGEAARDAEPLSPADREELARAEQLGKARAKGEDRLLDHPEQIKSGKK